MDLRRPRGLKKLALRSALELLVLVPAWWFAWGVASLFCLGFSWI